MKRKTSDVPTRIYSYGCLPPKTSGEIVEQQLWLAHQYRCALIAIERWRRGRIDEVTRENDIVGLLAAKVDALGVAFEQARTVLKAKRAGTGRRADVAAESAHVKAVGQQLKDARQLLKEARIRLKEDEVMQAKKKAVNEEAHTKNLNARTQSGLRHGTYMRVENAVVQASHAKAKPGMYLLSPKFTRYQGEGGIGTQLTETNGVMGLRVSEAFGCQDTRLQIVPVPADTYMVMAEDGTMKARRRHHRRLMSRTRVRLRVGSNPDRTPIWAEFPIILHRPLPTDGVIKWAYIVRKRIGIHYRYFFQLTLESEEFRGPLSNEGVGTVAINFGWRNLADGGIRVAYCVDNRGNERELRLPKRTQERVKKPIELRSIRDTNFDLVRAWFKMWLDEQPALPEWLLERVKHMHLWRAQRKLAAVVGMWAKQRFDGDTDTFEGLQAWAKQDRHLLSWEAHQRDSALGHRKDEYRKLAAELARSYATILIDDFKMTDVAEAPKPEDGVPSDGRDQRRTARLAAPGQLRDAIVKAAGKYGAEVIVKKAEHKTQTCHVCLCKEPPWDAAPSILHTCSGCGRTWDQDANNCYNLLKPEPASGDAATEERDPLAGGQRGEPEGQFDSAMHVSPV